jgi:imidazolonepropionase-like amidohydrolase
VADTPIQNGYSYATYWNGLYSDPNADRAVAELADMGAGWVSIVVTQYQDTLHSTAIAPTDGTPTDADVRHAIRAAHAAGMNVMLKPHVDLWNDPDHWRGEIGPNFTTAQWSTWFASYTAMIAHYAQLAAEEGVEQFAVGTELNSTTAREAQWRAVIAAVRAEFDGPLT